MPGVARNKERFKELADDYDLFRMAAPDDLRLQQEVAKAVGSMRGASKVIDIGCGTGNTTQAILEKIPRVRIIAVDNEPGMVRAAKKKLGARAEFVCRDALAFVRSLPAGSLDAVASAWTIHNFDRAYRTAFLKEVFRVLRPGGTFANGDKYYHDDAARRKRQIARQTGRFRAFLKAGREDLYRQWMDHYKDDMHPRRIMFEGEGKQELQTIGFRKVRTVFRREEMMVIGIKPEGK